MEKRNNPSFNLSGDKPLTDPKDDRLGLKHFAYQLAKAICHTQNVEGLVLSIYGAWGSGKSTLLNFVAHYLETNPTHTKLQIIYFNPWWFSESELLLQNFFEQIIASINPTNSNLKNIRKAFAKVGDALSKTPIPHSDTIKKAADLIRPANTDIYKLRTTLEKLLTKSNCKFVIIIDDIDRLINQEIRQIFTLIKAVVNLPNIIYLLAFDKKVVAKALESFHEGSGGKYLDKIIQIPFELPPPDKIALRTILIEKLNMLLVDTDNALINQDYFVNIYVDGLEGFIDSARDINRLLNTLAVTYPIVKNEVNPADFIALESLRVFKPEIYHIIRDNPQEFCGAASSNNQTIREQSYNFHNSYINGIQDGKIDMIKTLLQRLFPKLQSIWSNMFFPPEYLSEWRRNLRICHQDIFPIYFRLEISKGSISSQMMTSFLQDSLSEDAISKTLIQLSEVKTPEGFTLVRAFLDRLEDFTHDIIEEDRIPYFIMAIFNIADKLIEANPDRFRFYDAGIEVQLGRILFQLLKRLNRKDRYEFLQKAVKDARSISFIIHEIAVIGQFHGKYGSKEKYSEDQILLDINQQGELEKLAADRLHHEARGDMLFNTPNLAYVLIRWKEWQRNLECDEFLAANKKNSKFLLTLIKSALQIGFSQEISLHGELVNRSPKSNYRIDINFLNEFIDPSETIPIITDILKNQKLLERELLALSLYLKAAQGENNKES